MIEPLMRHVKMLQFAVACLCLATICLVSRAEEPLHASDCGSHKGFEFVCGIRNVEDLARIPGTDLLVGSAGVGPGATVGSLVLIDTKTRQAQPATLSVRKSALPAYADCPRPPDLSHFHPHGIAIRAGQKSQHTLYVVSHVDREAIEVFNIDASTSKPRLDWIGCHVMPEGAYGNGVVPLPDGGFVVTKFFDLRNGNIIHALTTFSEDGLAYRWRPRSGFEIVPHSEGVANNGVAISKDGKWMIMNLWSKKQILRFNLQSGEAPTRIDVDFMPDNIHLTDDGSMLVGGFTNDIPTEFACKRTFCPADWAIVRLDPETMKVKYLLWEKGDDVFSYATGALEIDGKLWISTFRASRVAIADPSLFLTESK